MTAALATLNPAAQVALVSCEQRIERGLKTFIDVGQALAEIRDSRLYKGTHDTFEDYCRERWGFNDRRASQMIQAADLASTIVGTGLPAPANEGQARALAAVPEPERAEVWREATERTGGKPTAKVVAEIARERTETPGPVGHPSTASAGPGPSPAPAAETPVPSQEPAAEPLAGCEKCGAELPAEEASNGYLRCDDCDPNAAHLSATFPDGPGPCVACDPAARIAAVAEVAPEFVKPVEPAPAPKPALRIVPDADDVQAAERRDARGLLLRAVEILAPAHDRAGFAETWARQLGPYDAELSELIRRATEAIATLDDLIERCGQ